jgi:small subunit ribosomal protein S8
MTNYPVGDYLIRIKNAARAERREVEMPTSKFTVSVAKALKKMGILEGHTEKDGVLVSQIAYHRKKPVLIDLKLVSKPGLRRYMNIDEVKTRKRRNASVLVLSTPAGVMGSKEAIKKNIGGEVIAEIW